MRALTDPTGLRQLIRSTALVVVLVVALVTTTGVSAGAAAPAKANPEASSPEAATSSSSTVPLRRAALRIVVQTSSDWVQVDLPGVSAGHVVAGADGGRTVHPTARGAVVRGQAGVRGSVTVDVVTEVPETLEQVWVTLKQGGIGSTAAHVENRTAAPFTAVSLSSGAQRTTANKTVAATALMGATQLPWEHADDERRVLAFTYPWFDGSAATDPMLSVHPTDPWRSWSGQDARRATTLARRHGIDGFVMSFAGGARHGLALSHALVAAAESDGTATILLETVEAGSAGIAKQWISEALRQAESPAFLRLDGVPVVFVFEAGRLSKAEWRDISERLSAAGTPVHLIGDIWDGQAGAMTGLFRYNALLQAADDEMTASELTDWNRGVTRALRARATLGDGEPGLVVATVQPGWDDRLLRGSDRLTVDWEGVDTYNATWQAALAGEPDWVVVTSWNEWYEGTGIAPSIEHASDALVATSIWAQRFGS